MHRLVIFSTPLRSNNNNSVALALEGWVDSVDWVVCQVLELVLAA
jgi:hypothetical protein